MQETTAMRWTLRGIRKETRETARLASSNMGRTIGQIVNEAVGEWVTGHPEALVAPEADDGSALGEAMRSLELLVRNQTEVLVELRKRLGMGS
jgi:hypothetical protein